LDPVFTGHRSQCRRGGAHVADTERWGVWETTLAGPSDGNPYVGITLSALLMQDDLQLTVPGFHDSGDGYKVRFGPSTTGEWHYETRSNRNELDGVTGVLSVSPASADNHGPVEVSGTYYLRHADGTLYFQTGTTCYAWIHQTDDLQHQTLATLADAPFNKIRFCVFPKSHTYNQDEPERFAFTRLADGSSDFDHLPEWRRLYGKPVIFDECRYEGNIPQGWGNIDAPEMTRRFWLGTMGGCYVGHGETYVHPDDILWWSKGGVLHGESPAPSASRPPTEASCCG